MPLSGEDIERLYDRHAKCMLRYFARRVWDPDVAVDLLAETFAASFFDRLQYRGSTDEEAAGWLYGIARHQLSAYIRRGAVERRAVERLGVERRGLTDPEYERIEELAGIDDLRSAVAHELERLPARQRDAVRLRVVDELSYAEVARSLAISVETARARVSRALRTLAERSSNRVLGEVAERG